MSVHLLHGAVVEITQGFCAVLSWIIDPSTLSSRSAEYMMTSTSMMQVPKCREIQAQQSDTQRVR